MDPVDAVPIPARPADLSAQWLTAVLHRAGVLASGVVASCTCEAVGTGQMGDSVRVLLDYDRVAQAHGPASVVAKLTASDERSRATGLALRSYEIEVRFYQLLAPHLPVRVPRCYHADVDVATGAFVLVLEDLAPAEPGDQLAGCTADDLALALEELVRVHAPRWGDPTLEGFDWLHRTSDASLRVGEQLLPALFAGFRERYADRLDAAILEVGERFQPFIGRYLRDQPRPWTIQHGDYRLDNLMFGGALEGRVAVVDWQTTVLGPPLVDVAYLIAGSLPVDARRDVEMDLLRGYHDALVAAGIDGYPWSRCLDDYRRYAYAGYVMAASASMLVERTDRGDEMFLTMARRHGQHVLDLDALDVLAR